MDLKGSKTEKNLYRAFAGESRARNKYSLYAEKARQEGYQWVGNIFDLTALNELAHARRVYKDYLKLVCNTKENLANYSFVFHRMKRDGLIYDDFQKLQFTYFLLKFEINIDRIKSMKEIGKLEYRESIYNRV